MPLPGGKGGQKPDVVQIDTSDILFIAAGTFSDLFDYRQSRSIGFAEAPAGRSPSSSLPSISSETLIAYGMLAELLGRLPVRVPLQALGEDELVAVLRDPPDALTRRYAGQLALDGVELSFDGRPARPGPRRARRAIGARGLRSLMETICRDLLFDAPERRASAS